MKQSTGACANASLTDLLEGAEEAKLQGDRGRAEQLIECVYALLDAASNGRKQPVAGIDLAGTEIFYFAS